jgi:glycosyltransferase involved in cell wall biosynthesis
MTQHLEWHYIGLAYRGPTIGIGGEKGPIKYKLYPQSDVLGGEEANYATGNLQEINDEVRPDIIWVYEDTPYVLRYGKTFSAAPVVGYVPWDVDYWAEGLERAMKELDVPVVMSDFAEKMCHDNGYDVHKIYNCVDETAFGPCPQEDIDIIRSRIGIPKDKKVVLYVGAIHARKNPESLFAMAQELKRIRGSDFMLVVHGNPFFTLSPCDSLAEVITRGIDDVIQFTPKVDWRTGVPPRSMNAIYNMADVFVSPHGGEGFGLPACEAGLCGKPFVMTDCTTTPEFYDGGKNGVAIPIKGRRNAYDVIRPMPDHIKMAQEVSALLDDEPKRKAMGAAFREHVLTKYTRKVLAPKWKELFDGCLVNKVRVKEI